VPHAVARTHPLEAAETDVAGAVCGVIESQVSLGDDGDRCKPGVRMNGEACSRVVEVDVKQVEKHVGLEHVTQVRWAHQAGDRTVCIAARPEGDAAKAFVDRNWQVFDWVHGFLLSSAAAHRLG
jgi:hypothetical protein